MSLVKNIVIVGCLALVAAWALGRVDGARAELEISRPQAKIRPARVDLAEAVLAMVLARAKQAGLPQPVTLCEACAAIHLEESEAVFRENCAKACGVE
jgi:hypothetical protein